MTSRSDIASRTLRALLDFGDRRHSAFDSRRQDAILVIAPQRTFGQQCSQELNGERMSRENALLSGSVGVYAPFSQRSRVCGVTSNAPHSSLGRIRLAAASSIRSVCGTLAAEAPREDLQLMLEDQQVGFPFQVRAI
jgi:hypothetical protein